MTLPKLDHQEFAFMKAENEAYKCIMSIKTPYVIF